VGVTFRVVRLLLAFGRPYPHILGGSIVVVGADKAGAAQRIGAAAGVLEQEQDARRDSRLGRIKPGDGVGAALIAHAANELRQRGDVRLTEKLQLSLESDGLGTIMKRSTKLSLPVLSWPAVTGSIESGSSPTRHSWSTPSTATGISSPSTSKTCARRRVSSSRSSQTSSYLGFLGK
jgi:hypothetical protein